MHVCDFSEHVPSTEPIGKKAAATSTMTRLAGGRRLEASYDVAQDERQDGKKARDQGVLDQVLTPLVTDETTRNRRRHVLLGAEFRCYVEEIIKASASGGVSG